QCVLLLYRHPTLQLFPTNTHRIGIYLNFAAIFQTMNDIATPALTAKDFATDQEVRWCPGCGDYSILAQVQKVLPTLGIPKENFVIISGIGCSSRFPYYM